MKTCTRCSTEKPTTDFPKNKGKPDGLGSWCSSCHGAYVKEHKDKYSKKKLEAVKRYNKKNPNRLRRNQLARYGMSIGAYYLMLAYQDFKCAICGTDEPGKSRENFCVDHNHETGNVRGLLCTTCNTAIGLLKDDVVLLEKAVEYMNDYDR